MISNFISVILRHGRAESGLFGKCIAYYGTVEAQARGMLHCHMLIWIKDHPSPQKMRDLMIEDEEYQSRLFTWLESLIKCEPLGTSTVVPTSALPRREHPRPPRPGFVHPGTERLPRIDALLPADFRDQYHRMVNRLVDEFNWHDHTETCWKYLRRGQPRTDGNCRMRMDGTTHEHTDLDTDTLSIRLRRLHPWIASYNDIVIFLLQANMDIKHIGSGEGAKALIFYITDYITKSSIPAHLGLAALLYAIDRTDVKYKGVQHWTPREQSGALNILEISHQQVMSHLVGGGDHYTSHLFRLLHYRTFESTVLRYWYPERNAPVATSLRPPSASTSYTRLEPTVSSPEETQVGEPRTSESGLGDTADDLVTLTLGPGRTARRITPLPGMPQIRWQECPTAPSLTDQIRWPGVHGAWLPSTNSYPPPLASPLIDVSIRSILLRPPPHSEKRL
ncbi:hypothetical protein K466DRAFT_578429 [Polyporus arcularius HHB13444]|uniref:Helitron helicase-like domain-containing protein n=1 Tax=Polyporus arcularius HHB13444 TaxID=1314778 RepID=A0A5C3NXH0_9APHY|nr:hypothetical protein K466DRAFT_578429 [Polyporus arcularius HHB13444]